MTTIQLFRKVFNNLHVLILLDFILYTKISYAQSEINSDKILIAIIDTGVDLKNPELTPFLWINPGETGTDKNGNDKASNGVDDDNNGYIDDLHGWNFVANNSNIQDFQSHGTHVLSTILNNLKHLGLENKIQFQILKYYHTDNDTHSLIHASNEAFRYALQFQPQLINYSGGGYSFSKTEQQLLSQFSPLRTLIIAASGNDHNNNDILPFYPASYQLDNVIAVASVSTSSKKNKTKPSSFSNFGKRTVAVFSEGENQWAFGLNQKKIPLSGTSQSTANLTSFAASILIEDSSLNPLDIKDFLCSHFEPLSSDIKPTYCNRVITIDSLKKIKGKSNIFTEIVSSPKI
ncbi:MAG: S8 family serine peptidase [Bdellovibrionaceae bacterium]|nr:S8 family serine peptidase [Pseudobdellovibrionaceae bacterium]